MPPQIDNKVPHSKPEAVVLIGPPGSGKGTMGRVLGEIPGFRLIPMGRMLRESDSTTKPGATIHAHLREGELVPVDFVVDVFKEELFDHSDETSILVLDGIPRSVDQAERLESLVDVRQVLHLACADTGTLKERIRQRSAGRTDDTSEAAIDRRFEIYRDRTAPLLTWYPHHIVEAVDAGGPPLIVLREVLDALQPERFGTRSIREDVSNAADERPGAYV